MSPYSDCAETFGQYRTINRAWMCPERHKLGIIVVLVLGEHDRRDEVADREGR